MLGEQSEVPIAMRHLFVRLPLPFPIRYDQYMGKRRNTILGLGLCAFILVVALLGAHMLRGDNVTHQSLLPLDETEARSSSQSGAPSVITPATIPTTLPGQTGPTRPRCISHGTVRWEDGDAVGGAEIYIYQSLLAQKVMGTAPHVWAPTGLHTDPDGGFRLPETEVCPLRLAASLDGEGWAEEVQAPVDRDEVPPYEIRRDLTMIPAIPVTGRVVDGDGAPIADALVSATRTYVAEEQWMDEDHEGARRSPEFWDLVSRWWAYRTLTDSTGRFSLTLTSDEWTLLAEAEGYPNGVEKVDNSDRHGAPVEIVLAMDSCWTIQVVDEGGVGLPDCEVTVGPQQSTNYNRQSRMTDEEGSLEVCDVHPHSARVFATAEGKVDDWIVNESGENPLLLTLGEGATLVGTLLPPATDEEACIVVGMGFVGTGGLPTSMRFSTDEQGRFEVGGVPPGQVSLQIACKGFLPAQTRAEIEPGARVDLGELRHDVNDLPPPPKNVWRPFAD